MFRGSAILRLCEESSVFAAFSCLGVVNTSSVDLGTGWGGGGVGGDSSVPSLNFVGARKNLAWAGGVGGIVPFRH